jgi:hypothetical protein
LYQILPPGTARNASPAGRDGDAATAALSVVTLSPFEHEATTAIIAGNMIARALIGIRSDRV